MGDIREIANKTGQALREEGADKAYYTVIEKETHEFNMDGGEFSLFRTLFDKGLSITAYKDQKKGTVATNRLDDAAIQEAVENCLKAADSGVEDEAFDIAPPQESEVFHKGVYEPDVDLFFERSRELASAIREKYPKIGIEQMILAHVKEHLVYQNTNGTEFETFQGYYLVQVMFSAHEGDTVTSVFGSGVVTDCLDTPFLKQGTLEKDLRDVEAQLHTVPLEGKFEGTIILPPGCLAEFLSYIANSFVSDYVILEKTSIWLKKLNEKVADERITISLSPGHEQLICGECYTDDGFKSQDYALIQDGILKSFMLSLYVANKSGFAPAKNTSNAFVIQNGDTPYQDMVKNIKRGIIVGRFSGGEPASNGDFSGVAKNSFFIEDGEIKGAVNEIMINGNLAELLNHLVSISSETMTDGTSVLPYMAFDGIVISGK